ncbi:restriction endonuclease subunit M [Erysipelotrichaceae bacterium MTC7]|nr:restriction endonuclease subunit M [Erysipelotrichaceae bacterium MTC7]
MTVEQKQVVQQAELNKKLWAIANDLRGSMDASDFKNYILGLIFYRFLSEKVIDYSNTLLGDDDNISYADAWNSDELKDTLVEEMIRGLGYVIDPKFLFSTLIEKIRTGDFEIEMLQQAINEIEESTIGRDSEDDFNHLFDDMDLQSSKLGRDNNSRTELIAKVMNNIDQINFGIGEAEIDVLGDAYEFLISQFAASAGKKAGEFYTPQQVSEILTRIVTIDKKDLRSVYDPACGSGSLLLRVGKHAHVYNYYGQELNTTTYNLARMNMLLHDIRYKDFAIYNTDTLTHPMIGEDQTFEAIVANPPYSANWSADQKFLLDPRFSQYGKLAPKSKADFAFVQDMIYHLDENGTLAVVLPHGVLFRGAAEGVIRTFLIKEKNYLDAVIGLPANIFFGTSIPTCILVFKKCREDNEHVLFIDASNEFESGKNQNRLTNDNVDKIVDTFKNREEIDKYSHLATMAEIKENEYNLNIPRYVDTFEEEEPIDIVQVCKEIEEINNEIKQTEKEFLELVNQLAITDESKDIIEATKKVFRHE